MEPNLAQNSDLNMDVEIWKPIKAYNGSVCTEGYPDFEGYYEISNFGRVKSLARIVLRDKKGNLPVKERILTPRPNDQGYLYVSLNKDSKGYNASVHCLVARAFLPPCPGEHANTKDGWTIDHYDRDKSNNKASNLVWMLNPDNALDGRINWTPFKGEKNGRALLSEKDVIEIRNDYRSYSQIACQYGVSEGTIACVIQNRSWKNIPYPNYKKQMDHRKTLKKRSKITKEQVVLIRNDARKLKEIARDYNLSPQTISRIKLKQLWPEVN